MRICCGAFKTSPVSAIQVELGGLPLDLRQKQLIMNYWVNLKGHSENGHPTVRTLLPCWESERAKRECFAWKSKRVADYMMLAEMQLSPTVSLPVTPPWLFPIVSVDFCVLDKVKSRRFLGNVYELVEERLGAFHSSSIAVYTDGSKDPNSGCTDFAVVIPVLQVTIKKKTPDHLVVFTVELLAISAAMQWVADSQEKDVIICSNSSSALSSIQNFKSSSRQDLIN